MPGYVAVITAMRNEMVPIRRLVSLTKIPSRPIASRGPTDGVASPHGPRSTTTYVGRHKGVKIVASVCGVGTERARAATRDLFQLFDLEHVLIVGIAGAISTAIGVGDLVVPKIVVDHATANEFYATPIKTLSPNGTLMTSDTSLSGSESLSSLEKLGVIAVDMETAAVAQVCTENNCTWSSIRSISDVVADGTLNAEILALAGPDGRPKIVALMKYLGRHPSHLAKLSRLGRDSNIATKCAARATFLALESL